jgi:uncharacterized protein (DUF2141 family)
MLLLAYIGLAFLGACAKVGKPQGGPLDEAAPTIVAHTPAADAIRVSADARVEILFNERMERQRTVEAIFVSPESSIEFQWPGFGGRQLVLKFKRPLQADRTYVVTVGTGARDLRNNPLAESYSFAFGTGDRLNQASISGFVFSDHEPVSGAMIWAYDVQNMEGQVGQASPAYRTQSGQDGGYEFLRLSVGSYRVIAFKDENRNDKLDRAERVALPSQDLDVGGEGVTRTGDLAAYRVAQPETNLEKVQALDRNRILLIFSREVEAHRLEVVLPELEILSTYNSPTDGRKVYIVTSTHVAGRSYRFERLQLDAEELEWDEPIRGSAREDRKPPEVVASFLSPGQVVGDEPLRLVMNEAIDADTLAGFWLDSDSTEVVDGRWERDSAISFRFLPAAPWALGKHRLQLNPALLTDLAGLSPRDSVYTYSFAAMKETDLGGITGTVGSSLEAEVGVEAVCKKSGRAYPATAAADGSYKLDGLVPCGYIVYSFGDTNGNHRHDGGVTEPYRAAEPYDRYPEPVTLVRGAVVSDVDMELR